MARAVAIALKIPDNTAYTALVALRRLGVDVARVERSEIHFFDDGETPESLLRRIESDERIFNSNTNRIRLLDEAIPRAGEVWIEPLSHPSTSLGVTRNSVVAWRLADENGEPSGRAVLDAAVERLLCNPAIERAVTRHGVGDRDNQRASE